MFKVVLISAIIVAAYCAPADKSGQDHLQPSETSWNSAWANPANPNAAWQNPSAWGSQNWNRWNNPSADPRWNRWGAGAEPWNRWGSNTGWNQWNRAGTWPATATTTANRGWNNPW